MAWIIANWETILAAITGIVAAASIITRITKTEVDDKWVARILKFIEVIALNNKPVEQKKT